MARPAHARQRPADMRFTAFVVLLVIVLVGVLAITAFRNASAAAETNTLDRHDQVHADDSWHGSEQPLSEATSVEAGPSGAKQVFVSIEGNTVPRTTTATTVKDLLVQMGIVLDSEHAVSHDLDAEVVDGTRIVIAKIDTKSVTEESDVEYETTEVEDPALPAGTRVVQTAGRTGTATTTFLVRYADGQEVLRTEVLRTVRVEARDEVVRVGTGTQSSTAPSSTPGQQGSSGAQGSPGSAGSPGSTGPQGDAGGSSPGATAPGGGDGTPSSGTTPTPPPAGNTPDPKPTQDPKPPAPTQPPTTQEPVIGAGVGPGTTPSSARTLAKSMAAARGWGADEFSCLDKLWMRESSWNFKARNPSSTARGIPQAMMSIHFGADWRTSAAARAYLETPRIQIEWGLNYIAKHKNFSTPCGAYEFWQNNGWY